MYTSIVLFCGFAIFAASEFGGTKSLGILVSVTLLFAMFSNLIILPSLLLTFENVITTKAFKEPTLHIYEEEDDEQEEPGEDGMDENEILKTKTPSSHANDE
jgi:hypothetical protein